MTGRTYVGPTTTTSSWRRCRRVHTYEAQANGRASRTKGPLVYEYNLNEDLLSVMPTRPGAR
jgi:hypothetical protein